MNTQEFSVNITQTSGGKIEKNSFSGREVIDNVFKNT